MKIAIRAATTGSGVYTTIADGTVGNLVDFQPPTMTKEPYVVNGYGADNKRVIDMGNAVWHAGAQIRKWYASELLARQAIATIGATLSGQIDVMITEDDDTGATYLPNCSCVEFSPNSDGQTGITIHYNLKFVGPNYTTTAP